MLNPDFQIKSFNNGALDSQTTGVNRWQKGIDEWAKDQSDAKYKPPIETSNASTDSVVVSIKNPSDKTTVTTSDHSVNIKAKNYGDR